MALSSHVIDQSAQNIFRNSIPPAWLKREQHPDFFLDYYIEVFEDNEPTGTIFAVQLKGQEAPKISKNYVKYAMKKKHLQYYQEKAKFPVFLFVVDVVNGKCWYLFIQRYLKEAILRKKWNGKKGLTVNIPIENETTKHIDLLLAIKEAEYFMADMRPSSIDAAIENIKERYAKIDDRFNIGLEIRDKATKYIISPKPDADVDIRVGFDTTKEKLDDLLGRGKQVEFSPNELIFSGSDLFASISKEIDSNSKVLVKTGYELDAEVTITCRKKRRDTLTLHGIKGKIRGGYKEIYFDGFLPNSPLNITLSFPIPTDMSLRGTGTFNVAFDADKWEKQPVSLLAYFNQIFKWLHSTKNSDHIKFTCEVDGNVLVGAEVEASGFYEISSSLICTLEFVKKIREISSKLNCFVAMPKFSELKELDAEQINFLHHLIMEKELVRNFSDGTISMKMTNLKITPEKIKEMAEKSGSIFVDSITPNITLFGSIVPGWVVKYEVIDPIVQNVRPGQSNTEAEIELSGSANSKLIYRLYPLP